MNNLIYAFLSVYSHQMNYITHLNLSCICYKKTLTRCVNKIQYSYTIKEKKTRKKYPTPNTQREQNNHKRENYYKLPRLQKYIITIIGYKYNILI